MPILGLKYGLTIIDAYVGFSRLQSKHIPFRLFKGVVRVIIEAVLMGGNSSSFKIDWRGVRKCKVVTERCFPMLRFAECNVCTNVFPVQHFGLKSVLEHYDQTAGEVLGKGSDALEGYTLFNKGYFAPGELPRFSVEEGGKGITPMAKQRGVV